MPHGFLHFIFFYFFCVVFAQMIFAPTPAYVHKNLVHFPTLSHLRLQCWTELLF